MEIFINKDTNAPARKEDDFHYQFKLIWWMMKFVNWISDSITYEMFYGLHFWKNIPKTIPSEDSLSPYRVRNDQLLTMWIPI